MQVTPDAESSAIDTESSALDAAETPSGAPPAPSTRRSRRARRRTDIPSLGYLPALDGLRGVAVAVVLLYHARFAWATGGFLGVSTFFTLSGFLITSLLVREHHGDGGVSLRRFWTRRMRRLIPASWVTLAVVLGMAALNWFDVEQIRDLRGDVPTALAQVINWHFIFSDRTYGDQFVAPSPLEHYWSLSVEEQFYWLFPLVVVGLLVWGRGRRSWLMGVLAGLVAASTAWTVHVAGISLDRAYFGTDSRLAELVIGALLALAVLHSMRPRSAARGWGRQVAGVAGLGVSIWLWTTVTVGTRWLYPWGLLLTAVASSALILSVLAPGPMASLFSWRPLTSLGRISYGVYLLHWPIFLWLTHARVGWGQWPLFALRMAVTLAAAVLMYRFVERPIRRDGLAGIPGLRWIRGRNLSWAVGLVAVIAILAATALVTAGLPAPRALARASGGVVAAPRATKVLVIGDELAAGFEPGLVAAEKGLDGDVDVRVAAAAGCGLALGGFVRLSTGTVERDSDRCRAVRDTWMVTVADWRPDVIMLWGALRDVSDRRLSIEEPWRRPGDPMLDDFLRADLGALTDDLSSLGAGVVLLTAPHVRNTAPPPPLVPPDPATKTAERTEQEQLEMVGAVKEVPAPGFAENEDARIDRWNVILGEVATTHDDTVLDLAGQMDAWPGGSLAADRRVAGVGVTTAAGKQLGTWLLGQAGSFRRKSAPAAAQPADAAAAPLPDAPPLTPRRHVAAGRPVRLLQAGDSLSYGVGYGLSLWEGRHGQIRVGNAGQFGCPIARGGSYRFLREINEFSPDCDWAKLFPGFLDDNDPDVVVLTSGIWEVVDRILPGDDRWRHIGQPDIDHYVLAETLSAIDTLAAKGASVVVLTYPHFEAGADQGFQGLPESEPARVERLNALLAQAVSLRPGVAWLVDLQGWLAAQPGGEMDPAKRDDGLHLSDAFVPTVADWLAPQLISLGRTGSLAGG